MGWTTEGQTLRVELARACDEHGEIALARRGDVLELVIDGVFAMDSTAPGTEEALAHLTLDRLVTGRPANVLVGGLGLGYTTRALLDDPRIGTVEVVELHPVLVDWAHQGLLPALLVEDGRLTVTVGDVLQVIPTRTGLDAVLLDVDNGPDFLVHQSNAPLYQEPFLTAAAHALAPGGVLAIWSSHPAPALHETLTRTCGPCQEVLLDVVRGTRTFTYAVYLAVRT